MIIQIIGWLALIISAFTFVMTWVSRDPVVARTSLGICGYFLIAAAIAFK